MAGKKTKKKKKHLLKPFYLYTDVAESIQEQYSEYIENGVHSPFTYFFTYWEDKDTDAVTFYKSKTAFKDSKNLGKVVNDVKLSMEDIIRSWHIELSDSSIIDARFTAFLAFIDAASRNGLTSKTMGEIHETFNNFRNKDLKEIANKQTFQEVDEIVSNLISNLYEETDFRTSFYPGKKDPGSIYSGSNGNKVADAIRYLMVAKETGEDISFRKQAVWLHKNKKEWVNLASDFNDLLETIKNTSLIPDVSNKNKFDAIKQTVKEAKKMLSGGILRKGLEKKLESYSKNAFEILQADFLNRLTVAKIKKTLEETEFSGLTDAQLKKVAAFYYILAKSHLFDVFIYVIYTGILKRTFYMLDKGPLHPVAKNSVVLTTYKAKSKPKKGKKKSDLKVLTSKKDKAKNKQAKHKSKSKDKVGKHECPICGDDVPNDAANCESCGEPVVQCPDCGEYIDENAKKCPNCGAEFSGQISFDCPVCGSEVIGNLNKCPICDTEFED
ncbi:MAG: zinc ribbon domain-containing protein [Candidatus Undinarchaeales archaeon]